jgi:hypothetical protein
MPPTLPRAINLKRALSLLGQAVGGTLDVERMKWTLSNGICLNAHGVTFTRDGRGVTTLKAKNLRFRISLLPLFKGKLIIKNLTLQQPEITLCTGASDTPGNDKQRSATPAFAVELRELHINDGRIDIEDTQTVPGQTIRFQLTHIEAQANHLTPGDHSDITLSLSIPGRQPSTAGTLTSKGQWVALGDHLNLKNAQMDLDTELDGLDAGLFEPYITATNKAATLDGAINASFNFRRDSRGQNEVKGSVNLDALRYIDANRWPEALPGCNTQLALELHFKPNHIDVLLPRLTLGEIVAGGRLELHPGPTIKRSSFTAKASTPALEPLIPWRALGENQQGLRNLLKGGGTIQVERLVLPTIDLSAPPDSARLLQALSARISLHELTMRSPSPWSPDICGLSGEIRLRNNTLQSNNLALQIGPFQLPTIELQADSPFKQPVVSATALGPVYLAGDTRSDIQEILHSYGINAFTGTANIDLKARYQSADLHPWNVRGLLHLHDLDITTLSSESRITLQGSLDANLAETLAIKWNKFGGTISDAPFLIDGLISGSDLSPQLVDLEVSCEEIELAPIAEILPLRADQMLGGVLQTELALRYSHAAPDETALNGGLRLRELQYLDPRNNIDVDQGECQLQLKGKRITLQDAIFIFNGQTLMFRGTMDNLENKSVSVELNSPQLNIDRLIGASNDLSPAQSAAEAAPQQEQTPNDTTSLTALPQNLVNKLQDCNLTIHANIERGSYQRRPFNQLELEANIKSGRIDSHTLNIGIAGGKVNTRGSLELAPQGYWIFDNRIDIRSVHLEKLLPWFGNDNHGYRGPASCKGKLAGHSGSGWLESLRGNLLLKAGPGKMPRVGALGNALHSTLALDRLKGQLKGTMSAREAATVIPVEFLLIEANFEGDMIDAPTLTLNTPGARTDWAGTLTLPELILAMDVKVSLLGELDAALGLMPVLGRAASNMSKVYLRIEGPLSNPTTTKTLHNSLDEISKQPIKALEKSVGKSLNKFKKFWS